MKSFSRVLAVCFVLAPSVLYAGSASAGDLPIVVDEYEDENEIDGDCSLREALISANNDVSADECTEGDASDRIELPAGTFLLDDGPLNFVSNVAVVGAGKSKTFIKKDPMAPDQRIVNSSPPQVLLMTDLTIAGGSAIQGGGISHGSGQLLLRRVVVKNNSADEGGGIWSNTPVDISMTTITGNDSEGNGGGIYIGGGTLTLADATVSDNDAASGGGLYTVVSATSLLKRATFSGNSAVGYGGGINNFGGVLIAENLTITGNTANGAGFSHGGGLNNGAGAATLVNVTITKNRAKTDGSGIHHDGGTLTIRNSIVSNNAKVDGSDPQHNCTLHATHTSDGYNLENASTCDFEHPDDLPAANPKLAPLRRNGGPTKTHALKPSSPAIDAASPGTQATGTTCKSTDQRNVSRPQDGPDGDGIARCDVGAFELRLLGHRLEVTLDLDRHLKADGRITVKDDYNTCRKNIRVLVMRRKTGGGWSTVADPRTTRRGRYDTSLPDNEGTYRSFVKSKTIVKGDMHLCRSKSSPKKEHRH